MCDAIKSQAEMLAAANRAVETGIEAIYWFPHNTEVRLVEVDTTTVASVSGEVEPFYFNAQPASELPAVSAIALVRPEEFGKIKLPEGWGDWTDAKRITS